MPEGAAVQALRFELCGEADVPSLMQFVGAEWQEEHVLSRDEALLRWQFAPELLQGRLAPGPTVMLAWLDGQIVGMLGLTGFELNVVGTPFPALWLSHWFAAPAYRRYNVALRLMWAVRDLGIDALATLGANEVSAKLLARLGLEVIPSLPRWVGVFDVDATAELVCLGSPGIALEDARRSCRSHVVALPIGEGPEEDLRAVRWSATAAAAWDHFWNEQLAPHLVGASRNAAYLRWRYLAHPRFRYQVRFAQRASDGTVEGIAAFRVEQVRDRATRVLRIVEFLATTAGEGCLARAVLEGARESGAALGDFYCSSARAAEALARAGFRRQAVEAGGVAFPSRLQPLEPGHVPMTALIRLPAPSRGTVPQLLERGRLYITKSDGDQDRPN